MYNKDKRRGLYKKPKARKLSQTAHPKTINPLHQHPLYLFLVQFLQWRQVKGFSPRTLLNHEKGVLRFITWCDERSLNQPTEITRPILDRYQQHLFDYRQKNGEPLSFLSQRTLLSPLKLFFQWLARQNIILYNPASEMEMPKVPMHLPKYIPSEEEMARVLALPDTHCPYGLRDKAILELLYSTGIRRTELANLEVYDVDRSRATLHIRLGKGGKDRILPLCKSVLNWVERYRLESRPLLMNKAQENHLFLTDHSEPFIKNRLSDLVKRYLYHAHIDKPGSCHLFRHAMATHMLDNGADIRFIQAMLGHAKLSTTEIYTQVSVEKLRAILEATHPANKK